MHIDDLSGLIQSQFHTDRIAADQAIKALLDQIEKSDGVTYDTTDLPDQGIAELGIAELDAVAEAAGALALAEMQAEAARYQRNQAILKARRAGAPAPQIIDAAGIRKSQYYAISEDD